MRVYLASPNNQLQASMVNGMPVLLSFACYSPWMDDYHPTFSHILMDSGAFSELNSGVKVDIEAYKDFSARFRPHCDAVAGLDDISGDWRRSLRNYELIEWGFPTFHEADPPELLDDLIAMARERTGWIGLGLTPPRHGKEHWVRAACDRIPEDLHVHGWACRAYAHVRRLDSVDATTWFREGMKLKTMGPLQHLTTAECLEIVVKRYQREGRQLETKRQGSQSLQPSIFEALNAE